MQQPTMVPMLEPSTTSTSQLQSQRLNLPVVAFYGALAWWGYSMKGGAEDRKVARAVLFPAAVYAFSRVLRLE